MQLLALSANTRKLREDSKTGPVFRTWAPSGPWNPSQSISMASHTFSHQKHGPWGSFCSRFQCKTPHFSNDMQFLAHHAKTRKMREEPEMGPVFQTWAVSGPWDPSQSISMVSNTFSHQKHGPWGSFFSRFQGKTLHFGKVMQLLALRAKTRKLREDTKMGPVSGIWALSGPWDPSHSISMASHIFSHQKHGTWGSF